MIKRIKRYILMKLIDRITVDCYSIKSGVHTHYGEIRMFQRNLQLETSIYNDKVLELKFPDARVQLWFKYE